MYKQLNIIHPTLISSHFKIKSVDQSFYQIYLIYGNIMLFLATAEK